MHGSMLSAAALVLLLASDGQNSSNVHDGSLTGTPKEGDRNMSEKQERRATGRTAVKKYEPKVFDEVPGDPR